MGEHTESPEAVWLVANYGTLEQHAGQWIAVIGNQVVDTEVDLTDLQAKLRDRGIPTEPCLFARVVLDRLG